MSGGCVPPSEGRTASLDRWGSLPRFTPPRTFCTFFCVPCCCNDSAAKPWGVHAHLETWLTWDAYDAWHCMRSCGDAVAATLIVVEASHRKGENHHAMLRLISSAVICRTWYVAWGSCQRSVRPECYCGVFTVRTGTPHTRSSLW